PVRADHGAAPLRRGVGGQRSVEHRGGGAGAALAPEPGRARGPGGADPADAGEGPAPPALGGGGGGGAGRPGRQPPRHGPPGPPRPPGRGRHSTVGRTDERAALLAAFEAAADGQGAVVCVTGEAGLGKTTLVQDVLEELADGGRLYGLARGRCSERLSGAEA